MIVWPAKPAEATAAYGFDFTPFLATGETITGTPTIDETNVTLAAGPTVVGNIVNIELAGGTAGTVAKVVCTVATSTGETWPATAVLAIGGDAIDLATAKKAQKIEDDDEDELLAGYLRSAIAYVEHVTGKNLTQKIETQTIDGFGWGGCYGATNYRQWSSSSAIRLFKGPVSEIVSVKYDDADGVEQTLSSFRLVGDKVLPAYSAIWPTTALGAGTVRVTYVAGYDPTELPAELVQAAILMFGHFNANREAVVSGDRAAAVELPLGVQSLLQPSMPGIV